MNDDRSRPLSVRRFRMIHGHARTRPRARAARARRAGESDDDRASGGWRSSPRSCSRWQRSASRGAGTRRRSGAGSRPGATRRRARHGSFANRAATQASQDRTQDLLNFNRWLEVTTDGNTELADLYERRFRDEFRPAFDRWIAEDPLHNPNATPSPLREPNYMLANAVKADQLEKLGDRTVRGGQGGDRARRRLRVRHRLLRGRAVLRRHLAALPVVSDARCSSWVSAR